MGGFAGACTIPTLSNLESQGLVLQGSFSGFAVGVASFGVKGLEVSLSLKRKKTLNPKPFLVLQIYLAVGLQRSEITLGGGDFRDVVVV